MISSCKICSCQINLLNTNIIFSKIIFILWPIVAVLWIPGWAVLQCGVFTSWTIKAWRAATWPVGTILHLQPKCLKVFQSSSYFHVNAWKTRHVFFGRIQMGQKFISFSKNDLWEHDQDVGYHSHSFQVSRGLHS